jgi:hypothetical protein
LSRKHTGIFREDEAWSSILISGSSTGEAEPSYTPTKIIKATTPTRHWLTLIQWPYLKWADFCRTVEAFFDDNILAAIGFDFYGV